MQESMRVISGGNTGNAARLWHTPLRTRAAVRRPCGRGRLAVGLAGGWAVLYGALLPFGPGLALGLGEDCFAASAAGAALGLLLHGFGALSLQSICLLCGLGAIVAGRWLWPGRFLPAAAAGGAALACSAFCLSLGAEGGGVELLLFCGRMPCWPGPSALGCALPARKARRGHPAARHGLCRGSGQSGARPAGAGGGRLRGG